VQYKNSKEKNAINSIIDENRKIFESQEIANCMNNYFCNIGENLSKKLVRPKLSFEKYMDNSLCSSIFCNEITSDELQNIIKNLKPNKSPGCDNIGPSLVIYSAECLLDPLVTIFNQSLSKGIVPDKLKIANVIPVFKKGDIKQMSNYRPISLLSVFNKILEKVVYDRLINFFNKFDVINKNQFGFRKAHSTSLALIETIDLIYESLDNQESVIGIYVDLQKAFDTVNHQILLKKLYNYGIRGPLLQWLKNYLSDRLQYTVINSIKSNCHSISCGVPQGSTLGPLLFLVYVNDIVNSDPNAKIKLFADDTNLFIHDQNIVKLIENANNAMVGLNDWLLANKLSLNIDKTCYSLFTHKKTVPKIEIKINHQHIERVTCSKYLGVFIDENLTWSDHTQFVKKKIARFAGIFYKIRNSVPKHILRTLYFSMIYPHILYGIELFANTFSKYLDPIIKMNNKLLRILQNQNFRSSVNDLYTRFNTLPLPLLFKFQILQIMHKFNHFPKLLPLIYSRYFNVSSEIHSHNTRRCKDLHQYFIKTATGSRSLKILGPKLWNLQPTCLKLKMSINVYKIHVKNI